MHHARIALSRAQQAAALLHLIWNQAKTMEGAEGDAIMTAAQIAGDLCGEAESELRSLIEGDDLEAMEVEAPLQ